MIRETIKNIMKPYIDRSREFTEVTQEIRKLFNEGKVDGACGKIWVDFGMPSKSFRSTVLENFKNILLERKNDKEEVYCAERKGRSFVICYRSNGSGRITFSEPLFSEIETDGLIEKVDEYIKSNSLTQDEADLIFDLTGVLYSPLK